MPLVNPVAYACYPFRETQIEDTVPSATDMLTALALVQIGSRNRLELSA